MEKNIIKDDRKFIAQLKTSMQISPDDWDTITPAIEVTRETTVGEIIDWMSSKYRYASECKIIPLDKSSITEKVTHTQPPK